LRGVAFSTFGNTSLKTPSFNWASILFTGFYLDFFCIGRLCLFELDYQDTVSLRKFAISLFCFFHGIKLFMGSPPLHETPYNPYLLENNVI